LGCTAFGAEKIGESGGGCLEIQRRISGWSIDYRRYILPHGPILAHTNDIPIQQQARSELSHYLPPMGFVGGYLLIFPVRKLDF
jgi:hypothetical protein